MKIAIEMKTTNWDHFRYKLILLLFFKDLEIVPASIAIAEKIKRETNIKINPKI